MITETKDKWGNIPEYMQGGINRWIMHGIPPGSFLTAVLENNLKDACVRADSANKHLLLDYVHFFHNFAPSESWGSVEKVTAWKKIGGMDGVSKARLDDM